MSRLVDPRLRKPGFYIEAASQILGRPWRRNIFPGGDPLTNPVGLVQQSRLKTGLLPVSGKNISLTVHGGDQYLPRDLLSTLQRFALVANESTFVRFYNAAVPEDLIFADCLNAIAFLHHTRAVTSDLPAKPGIRCIHGIRHPAVFCCQIVYFHHIYSSAAALKPDCPNNRQAALLCRRCTLPGAFVVRRPAHS